MAFHAHTLTHRVDAGRPDYMPHWPFAMMALTAASWAVTIGAVRLLIAVF